MKKKLLVLAGLCLLLTVPMASGQSSDAIESTPGGHINWSNGWIYAKGMGTCSMKHHPGQRRLMAQRAARVDGQRNLLEIIKGVAITSETVVNDFVVESDTIRVRVEGVLQYAVLIGGYNLQSDNCTVEVTMAAPIYPNLSRAIIQTAKADPKLRKKIDPPARKPRQTYRYTQSTPKPPPPPPPPPTPPPPPPRNPPPPPPPPPPPSTEHFSASKLKWDGLVIDGRRAGAKPALLPVIYNESGTVIYSRQNVNDQTTIKSGIVGYARDLGAAKRHYRVARDPLVVVAKRASGTKKTDPVISNAAGNYIKRTEPSSGYLRMGRVMLVF